MVAGVKERKYVMTRLKLTGLVLILTLSPGIGFSAQADNVNSVNKDAAILLEEAGYIEETLGDFEEAARIYRRIADGAESGRAATAQALYRLGKYYEERGRGTEAQAAFERLAKQYPEQRELISRIPDLYVDQSFFSVTAVRDKKGFARIAVQSAGQPEISWEKKKEYPNSWMLSINGAVPYIAPGTPLPPEIFSWEEVSPGRWEALMYQDTDAIRVVAAEQEAMTTAVRALDAARLAARAVEQARTGEFRVSLDPDKDGWLFSAGGDSAANAFRISMKSAGPPEISWEEKSPGRWVLFLNGNGPLFIQNSSRRRPEIFSWEEVSPGRWDALIYPYLDAARVGALNPVEAEIVRRRGVIYWDAGDSPFLPKLGVDGIRISVQSATPPEIFQREASPGFWEIVLRGMGTVLVPSMEFFMGGASRAPEISHWEEVSPGFWEMWIIHPTEFGLQKNN